MPITIAAIVPHPPLIIPEVGRGQQAIIADTVRSYRKAAEAIADTEPETIIIISPHAVAYADYFHIASGAQMSGSLSDFGGKERITVRIDTELAEEISRICDTEDFPAGMLGEQKQQIDHGTFIPLAFINEYLTQYRLVCCSLSGLSREEHYRFGTLIKQAVEQTGRRTALVASGDLSHALKERGPYSFAPEGPMLDHQITECMKSGNFMDLLTIDEELRRKGAECGLGAFVIMAGILDKQAVEPELLSYEGPFGVGYAVGIYKVKGYDARRNFLEQFRSGKRAKMTEIRQNEDAYVQLARQTLEHYVETERLLKLSPEAEQLLPPECLLTQAGAFVSIHKSGQLRGCIGTIEATQENLALEIMYNAISAGTKDPRFFRVMAAELPYLEYHVDVLSAAKPVTDRGILDPKKYGIIVMKGAKRGVLLPDLEGVDTIEAQLSIACQKAGIAETDCFTLAYFEVVRHT